MVDGYRAQLKPLTEQRDRLAEQETGTSGDDVTSARANLIVAISALNQKISELRALDTTPGYLNKKPVAPQHPTGAGLPLLLGLGGVVGIALGLLMSWVRLVFDPAVRSTRELVRSLGAPLLGTLPRERAAARSLLAIGRPGSRLAEEYRAVAFRLAYDPSFAERRRLLVTAPRGDNDMARAAAANLAAAFAEMGRDVLLVEADLRTPSLAAELGAARPGAKGPRWATGQQERGWPADSRANVDVPGSGAFTLVAGRRTENVPRALTSAPVSRILAEGGRPGAVVIVLAPPVLSYADAVALVDRVEGVVIVCRPREVHRSDLERIREVIGAAGGSVLGTLLHPGYGRVDRRARRNAPGTGAVGSPQCRSPPPRRPGTATRTWPPSTATRPRRSGCAPWTRATGAAAETAPPDTDEGPDRGRLLGRGPGVAALTNILVLVAAARLSTVAGFARFSAVYLVFTVLLGVSGAYTGQPLVLRRGGERTPAVPAGPPPASPWSRPPSSADCSPSSARCCRAPRHGP